MIGIINYGVGNLASVKNSLDFLGVANKIIKQSAALRKCDKIILPGVGAFGPAIEKLNQSGFSAAIKKYAVNNKPILGICLGMQLLMETSSEQGKHRGLGLIAGTVEALGEKVKNLSLPHIGWNEVAFQPNHPLFTAITLPASFYFVHSYYCRPTDQSAVAGWTNYSIRFASVLGQNNIWGCQFHPEKSQAKGLKILENFALL